jgi:hypothetical protein
MRDVADLITCETDTETALIEVLSLARLNAARTMTAAEAVLYMGVFPFL